MTRLSDTRPTNTPCPFSLLPRQSFQLFPVILQQNHFVDHLLCSFKHNIVVSVIVWWEELYIFLGSAITTERVLRIGLIKRTIDLL